MKTTTIVIALMLTACVSGPAKKAPPAPVIKPFADNKTFMLVEDMIYPVGGNRSDIVVPRGFVTDFASVPSVLWSTGFSPHGRFSRAAIIHDYLYWSQICSRVQADNIMLLAMKGSGVSMPEQVALYQGVQRGGAPAWNENRQDRDDGKPRVVPIEYFAFSGEVTWDDYEKKLMAAGVKDPVFLENPDYCVLGDTEDYSSAVEAFLRDDPSN